MKSIIFFFSIIFPVILFSQIQSGWYWVNPLPQGDNLYTIDYINENLIFAAGESGTIIRSTDGGITWNVLRFETFKKFNDMLFID